MMNIIMPFCNLFMGRPSYFAPLHWTTTLVSWSQISPPEFRGSTLFSAHWVFHLVKSIRLLINYAQYSRLLWYGKDLSEFAGGCLPDFEWHVVGAGHEVERVTWEADARDAARVTDRLNVRSVRHPPQLQTAYHVHILTVSLRQHHASHIYPRSRLKNRPRVSQKQWEM